VENLVKPAGANPLTIVGCGNLNRCDDGVGVVVAQRLARYVRARNRSDVRVFDAGTDGMAVMFRARGARRLLIVDASRTGSEPGAIFKVPGTELAQDYQPAYNLHDFRWDHALHAGRKIYGRDFPADVTVYLIEAARLGLGCELSEPVLDAADRVAAELESLIDQVPEAAERQHVVADEVRIAHGSIYLDRDLCERYLPDVVMVALLVRAGKTFILPLRGPVAGGLLLKVRNARGDRVVHAAEFLSALGISPDAPGRQVLVQWAPEIGGLWLQ
jgi:hydrogenase maturation protease